MQIQLKMAYTVILRGRDHQGSDSFPAEARGKQCVPCCLIFLITVFYDKHPKDISEEDVQEILLFGSNFYCAIKRAYGVLDDGFVDPHFTPRRVKYRNKAFFILHKMSYSGLVGNAITISNRLVFSLESAILDSVKSYKYFIAVFCGVSVGIVLHENCFYVFDSHSRNANGLHCLDGTAVLGVVECLKGLCSYLRNLVESLGQNVDNVQFELNCYSIRKKYMKTNAFGIELFDSFPGFRIQKILRKRKITDERDCLNITEGYVEDKNVSDLENNIIENFLKLVSKGPDYVCCCCTQTFFRHDMKHVNNALSNKLLHMKKYLSDINSVNDLMWLCSRCLLSLNKGKTPKFWLHNGLEFPVKPPELQLSNLEERLVSPRLAFKQLFEMPRGGQLDIKGNIVNVPADESSTVKVLPRLLCEDDSFMFHVHEKISIEKHIPFNNICFNKLYDAAKWLLSNSYLFENEGIVLNESLLSIPQEMSVVDNTDSENEACSVDTGAQENAVWTEDENYCERDTCLPAAALRELNQVLSVVPAEKKSPVSWFMDIHSEVLAFPTIFCGQPRVENSKRVIPLSYGQVCMWELRNMDRRVANNIPNIFFKLKILQMNKVNENVSTQRTNTMYWEQVKTDVFAMIHQFGIPTWFCSFTADENNWVPLFQSLSKLANGTCLSTADYERLSWQEKCKLMKADPVTCVRYFDLRVHTFVTEVLRHRSMPVGKIIEYFYRIDFQQQGLPLIHMFAWVKNAPVHGKDPDSTVIAFIDKYVTCAKDDSIPDLIKYQTHRHSSTCRNKGKDVCHVQFPILPMPETVILYPLIEEQSDDRLRYSEDAKRISSLLNEFHKTGEDLSFEYFLKKLNMDYSYYRKVISSTIVRPKVFLKRNVSECGITSYNSILLKAWMANIDLQYVLDPYMCVSYIMSYFSSKRPRCLSNVLLDACSAAQRSDNDIRDQDKQICNQLLTSVEMGPQEAVFLILQLPLRRCSRAVVFVDTNQPKGGKSLKKSCSEMKNLPKNSKDIEIDNALKRYKRRPKCMEMVCYADFVSWYEMCTIKKQKQNEGDHDVELSQELPDTEDERDQDDNIETGETIKCGEVVKFPCGTQMRKRSFQKIIKYDITSIKSDREDHYRQKLMLYTHWRDENDLIKEFASYEESFDSNIDQVRLNLAANEKWGVDDELLLGLASGDEPCVPTELNTESQHHNEEMSSPMLRRSKRRRRCVNK